MFHTATVAQLRQKIDRMQAPKLAHDTLPTHPALSELFIGGSLRRGCTYAVEGSLQLALTLIMKASSEGVWCGIVGLPHLGIEAAYDLGIRLDRLILIPSPGAQTLAAVSSLTEVLGVILTGPLPLSPHQNERLTGRLREHQSTLITATSRSSSTVPVRGAESRLTVEGSHWSGLANGFGLLNTRELSVRSHDRNGTRSCILKFEKQQLQRLSSHNPTRLQAVRS